MAFGFGTLVCLSVFLEPLEAEFAWSRGQTAFAYSSAALLAGFGGMATGGWLGGAIHDQRGGYAVSFAAGALAGIAHLTGVGTLISFLSQ